MHGRLIRGPVISAHPPRGTPPKGCLRNGDCFTWNTGQDTDVLLPSLPRLSVARGQWRGAPRPASERCGQQRFDPDGEHRNGVARWRTAEECNVRGSEATVAPAQEPGPAHTATAQPSGLERTQREIRPRTASRYPPTVQSSAKGGVTMLRWGSGAPRDIERGPDVVRVSVWIVVHRCSGNDGGPLWRITARGEPRLTVQVSPAHNIGRRVWPPAPDLACP